MWLNVLNAVGCECWRFNAMSATKAIFMAKWTCKKASINCDSLAGIL